LAEVWPDAPQTWQQLYDALAALGRWHEAEQTARQGLAAQPLSPDLYRRLADALMRQDRTEQAADVLRQGLARRDDPALRAMLAQIEGELARERGMGHAESAHFALHVEAGASARDARQVLDFLEKSYTDLARTLDYDLPGEIPVILYPDSGRFE